MPNKDPAFLFYFNDFLVGTADMTNFDVGCYIRLLCLLAAKGSLSQEQIKTFLGSAFGQSWPALQKKFVCKDGLYYNERLEFEKDKRSKWTESRRKNAKHMHEHMENVNVNENVSKKFIKPTVQEIKVYCISRENKVDALKFFNHYESNGWKVGRNPMKDWKAAVRTWESSTFDSNKTPPKYIEPNYSKEDNERSRLLMSQAITLAKKMKVA